MGNAYVGTSGFAYREWRGTFYPERKQLPDAGLLTYYASRLGGVEIDSTFYRMPNAKTLDGWKDSTPEGFKFALKASQKITHWERLKVPSDSLEYLLGIVPRLESRLGALLYQLPPNLKVDAERLERFLAQLPRALPCAFEFRNPTWFAPPVYALLERHGAGLVINDGDEGCTPVERTAPLVYLRLRRSLYTDEERARWCDRIRTWASEGDVFAFVKHEENPDAPRIALELAAELAPSGASDPGQPACAGG